MYTENWEDNNSFKFLKEAQHKSYDNVALYVNTYAKYNAGDSDAGDWLYPADYDTRDDFFDACFELHADENDPEIMFQVKENLPDELYDESDFSEEAFDFAEAMRDYSQSGYYPVGAMFAYCSLENTWDRQAFEDRYAGEYDSDEDFVLEAYFSGDTDNVDDETADRYIDYRKLGELVKNSYDEEDDYSDMSDWDAGVAYEKNCDLTTDEKKQYIDMEKLARDIRFEGGYEREDGFYFFNR